MRRVTMTAFVLAILAFLGYATLVSHAQRPCLIYKVQGNSECLKR